MTSFSTDPSEEVHTEHIWGRRNLDERLMPQHLEKEFGCTSSVSRQAMLRLAEVGFTISQKIQGFHALPHSHDAFPGAAHLRLLLEQEAIGLSNEGRF